MEKIPEIYSLHRYVDENGLPNREKIFVRTGDSLRERLNDHINPDLLKILKNQPDQVKDVVNEHLYDKNDGKGCAECLKKYQDNKIEKQGDLQF